MPATITWAGESAPLLSVSYAAGVGISPQTVSAVFVAAGGAPALAGDLAFGSDFGTMTLRDCHLDRLEEHFTAAGRIWTVTILDRRWRWRDGYAVRGNHNQTDQRGKLVPRTVRSPHQLARMLLGAMGEPVRHVVTGTFARGAAYTLTVNGVAFAVEAHGVPAGPGDPGTPGPDSVAEVAAALAGQIGESADETIAGQVRVTAAGNYLYLEPVDADAPTPVVTASATGLPSGGAWYAVAPIDLPAGLAAPADPLKGIPPKGDGDGTVDAKAEFLALGTNTPPTGTNPPVAWDELPAARALAALAEEYGRVVVWDPVTDAVSVQVEGSGPGIPSHTAAGDLIPLLASSPSLDPRQIPSAIVVKGAPTRYQVRLAFRAVGRDWDGSYRPLSELSYAPSRAEQKMRAEVYTYPHFGPFGVYTVTINGVPFVLGGSSGGGTEAGYYAAMAAAIGASTDERIAGKVTVYSTPTRVVIEAVEPGYEFEVITKADGLPAGSYLDAACVKGPIPVVPYPQTVSATFGGTFSDALGIRYAVTVNGQVFSTPGADHPDLAAVCADLAAAVNGSTLPGVAGRVTAAASGPTLTLTATAAGVQNELTTGGSQLIGEGDTGATWEVTTALGPLTTTGGRGFERSHPPLFVLVTPTERVSYRQAQQLAQRSIYLCYQLAAVTPDDGRPGIPLPGFDDRIGDRTRLVLLPTRPEQTVPRAGDENRLDLQTGQPVAVEVYDGYAKDRPPQAFGGISHLLTRGGIWARHTGASFMNSPRKTKHYISLSIADGERQVVEFAEPVHRLLGDTCHPSDVVIETGVLVLDDATRTPLRYTYTLPIPGGLGPPRVVIREDVRLEVIGEYDAEHKLTGYHRLDADAEKRAAYYAAEIAKKYATTSAAVIRAAGLYPISLSGVVRQVSWSLSAEGFTTGASANTEYGMAIIPYPRRRMAENLPPDPVQVARNAMSTPFGGDPGAFVRRMNEGR